MTMTTRRDVLLASAALPIAAAVNRAPLSPDELRVLAMTATPPEVWDDPVRRSEYGRDRVVSPGTELHRIVWDLEARGLVKMTPTPWSDVMDWKATATPVGIEALRRVGVEVT